jgi:hypothetical protein
MELFSFNYPNSSAMRNAKGGPISAKARRYANGGPVGSIDPRLPLAPPPPAPSGSSDPDAFKNLPAGPAPTGSSDPDAYKNLESTIASSGAEALSSVLAPKGGGSGGSAASVQPEAIDPRSILAQAPRSGDHNNPALSGAISGAAGTIGALAGTAASAALGAVNGVAPGAGSVAGGAASQVIAAGAQMAGQVVNGAVNVLSSLLVGTATPAQTGQGYGAPLLAPTPAQPQANYQSIHNGNIVTNNLTEYQRLKDRKEAQRSAPFFNRVGS